MKKIRVLLADDHLVVRMGLSAIIANEKDFCVAAEAADGEEAVEMAKSLKPDLVLLDLKMPKLAGVEVARRIKAENPAVKILVFTSFGESEEIREVLAAGADGALIKGDSREKLLEAMRRTMSGEQVLGDEIRRTMDMLASVSLSPRQRTVLELAAKGLNNREIGAAVGLGADCVKAHLSAVFARLNVSCRSEAVAFAVSHGIIKV